MSNDVVVVKVYSSFVAIPDGGCVGCNMLN